ncbi:hypothetical protein [Bythopirellula polymerisocia]|uniref:Carboxypeptidase regulatory-like domain-containing protein n=1 Tax=Bythopirellula polymerisocia TaxID=2528003 RepID=A0A5C6CE70_9BACT|nr:hypothetical protein [Bythopirellula polymerisocia]TWU21804.1 hypothetical protein Pla144_45000 [Bythopirellula polymerisocia]
MTALLMGFIAGFTLIHGCSQPPPMTSVKGKVLYNSEPLKFGVVMFHPPKGQVAQAEIQSDGTFDLSTFRKEDGVIPGHYKVSVLCYEAHDSEKAKLLDDEEGGMLLGKSLIPLKYTRANSSGLTADIQLEGTPEVVLELQGPSL